MRTRLGASRAAPRRRSTRQRSSDVFPAVLALLPSARRAQIAGEPLVVGAAEALVGATRLEVARAAAVAAPAVSIFASPLTLLVARLVAPAVRALTAADLCGAVELALRAGGSPAPAGRAESEGRAVLPEEVHALLQRDPSPADQLHRDGARDQRALGPRALRQAYQRAPRSGHRRRASEANARAATFDGRERAGECTTHAAHGRRTEIDRACAPAAISAPRRSNAVVRARFKHLLRTFVNVCARPPPRRHAPE